MTAKLIWSDDFDHVTTTPGHFFEPGGAYNASGDQGVFNGAQCQRGWSLGPNAATNDGADAGLVHRAYSISDFSETVPPSPITKPVLYSLMVYIPSGLHLAAQPGNNATWDWASTLTVASKDWLDAPEKGRLLATGLDPRDEVVKWHHVPKFGMAEFIYLNPIPWPRDTWVHQCAYIDFSSENGFTKLYQNGIQICHAKIDGGLNEFTKEHAGFYASPAYAPIGPEGGIYNARKRIYAVDTESDCVRLIRPLILRI
jgi:hypothetical protein